MTTLTRMIWHLTTLRLPLRERPGLRAELEALAGRIRAAVPAVQHERPVPAQERTAASL
jgi:hypothetical protein